MAHSYDYTFNNSLIKRYFDGEDSYVPLAELIHLHRHPLMTPNFMTQLSEMIATAGKAIEKNKLGSYYTDRLQEAAIGIGKQLSGAEGGLSISDGAKMLEHMREVYKLCLDLSSMV